MPVAVYNGTDVGGVDLSKSIPQNQHLTHTHLTENHNHGGESTPSYRNPLNQADGPFTPGRLTSRATCTRGRPQRRQCRLRRAGRRWSSPATASRTWTTPRPRPAWHTVTACKQPCNRSTGIAYPIADGNGRSSTQASSATGTPPFGPNPPPAGSPGRPQESSPGTYTYFCRVHPFMRGTFRVEQQLGPKQTLSAKKEQKLAGAAVSLSLDKPATVGLQARVRSGEGVPSRAGSRALSSGARRRASQPVSIDPTGGRTRSSSSSRSPHARRSGQHSAGAGRGRSSSPPRRPTGSARPLPRRPSSG